MIFIRLKKLFFLSVLIAATGILQAQIKTPVISDSDIRKIDQLTADDDESLMRLNKDKQRIRKVLSPADLKSIQVDFDDGISVPLDRIEENLTASIREFESDLLKASGAILSPGKVTDLALETEDSFIISRSVLVVVTDPVKLSKSSPEFNQYLNSKPKNAPLYRTLKGKDKELFDNYIRKHLSALPDNHPVKIASAQGNDAILKTIHDGLGDFEISDTVTFSKKPLRMINGVFRHPAFREGLLDPSVPAVFENSALDFTKLIELKDDGLIKIENIEIPEEFRPQYYEEIIEGKTAFSQDFLTGFTKGRSWDWEKKWRFGVGFYRLSLGASYGYGFRLPMTVEVEGSPKLIDISDAQDKAVNLSVSLKMIPRNGDEAFYRNAGLPEDKIFKGNELVLEAGFYYGMKLYALGKDWIHIRKTWINKTYSESFTPPLGDTKANKMFEIDPELTGTKLGGDYLNATLTFGLNMEMSGTASIQARISYPDLPEDWQTVRFDSRDAKTITRRLPAMDTSGSAVRTKYATLELRDPSYTIRAALVPALKGTITVDTPVYGRTFSTGWKMLNAYKLQLGSMKFEKHAGTRGFTRDRLTRKIFRRLDPERVVSRYDDLTGKVMLRVGINGKFVRPDYDDNRLLKANRNNGMPFNVHLQSKEGDIDVVALRNKAYIRAGVGENSALALGGDDVGEWQLFRVHKVNHGIVLQAKKTGKFVTVGNDGILRANQGGRSQQGTVFYVYPYEDR